MLVHHTAKPPSSAKANGYSPHRRGGRKGHYQGAEDFTRRASFATNRPRARRRARARTSREIAEQGREFQFPTAALESSMGHLRSTTKSSMSTDWN